MPYPRIDIAPRGKVALIGRLTLAQAYELKAIAEARIAEEPPVDVTPAPEFSEPDVAEVSPEAPSDNGGDPTTEVPLEP